MVTKITSFGTPRIIDKTFVIRCPESDAEPFCFVTYLVMHEFSIVKLPKINPKTRKFALVLGLPEISHLNLDFRCFQNDT